MIPYPHAVSLRACNLITPTLQVSLVAMLAELNVYEDVFQNCLTGSVILVDGQGLPDCLPLCGEEYVYVEWTVPISATRIQQLFRVVRLTDRTYPTEEFTRYTLHLAAVEMVSDVTQRLSMGFQNQPVSTMAQTILQTQFPGSIKLAGLDLEPTTTPTDVLVGQMSPLQAMNLMASRAESADGTIANWLFWENLTGWHFRSLSSLFGQTPVTRLSTVYGNLTDPDPLAAFRHTESLAQQTGFDVLRNLASGFYANRTILHDIIRGGYVQSDTNYLEDFGTRPHTVTGGASAYPLCRPAQQTVLNPQTSQMLIPANSLATQDALLTSQDPSMRATHVDRIMEHRVRQLLEIRQRVSLVTVPGHPDLQAGVMVDLQYPTPRYRVGQDSTSQTAYQKQSDPFLSGPHVVLAVRHILTAQDGHFDYRCVAETSRDCLGTPLP